VLLFAADAVATGDPWFRCLHTSGELTLKSGRAGLNCADSQKSWRSLAWRLICFFALHSAFLHQLPECTHLMHCAAEQTLPHDR
jgi:hypothetical protein